MLGERSHSPHCPSLQWREKQGKRTEMTYSLNELCTLQELPYTKSHYYAVTNGVGLYETKDGRF